LADIDQYWEVVFKWCQRATMVDTCYP